MESTLDKSQWKESIKAAAKQLHKECWTALLKGMKHCYKMQSHGSQIRIELQNALLEGIAPSRKDLGLEQLSGDTQKLEADLKAAQELNKKLEADYKAL